MMDGVNEVGPLDSMPEEKINECMLGIAGGSDDVKIVIRRAKDAEQCLRQFIVGRLESTCMLSVSCLYLNARQSAFGNHVTPTNASR